MSRLSKLIMCAFTNNKNLLNFNYHKLDVMNIILQYNDDEIEVQNQGATFCPDFYVRVWGLQL